MAEAQLLRCHDEYSCTVCLDTLNDPVSLSCGHSFCLKCLNNLWDQSQVCSCPECGETFTTRPELHINTVLNKTIRNLKQNAMAVKTCLTCMLCAEHQKHLELFCKTDETCICIICVMTGHKGQSRLYFLRRLASFNICNKMLQMFYQTVVASALFYAVVFWGGSIKRKDASRLDKLVRKASSMVGMELDSLTSVAERRALSRLLSIMENPLHPLNSIISRQRSSFSDRLLSLSCSTDRLRRSFLPQTMRLFNSTRGGGGVNSQISSLVFFSLLSDFCSLTLDINTAHRELRLSEGSMKVTRERTEIKYPDHPDRFDYCPQGLCMEALSGARCYWEVECSGDNMLIGVAYKGLSRKGEGRECSLGFNDKSWCLQCFNSQYFVYHDSQQTAVSISYCPKLGVYLDWSAGSLSFYSVSHTMTLLHRFNTSFTEPLYPGIGLDYNCSVTICHLTPALASRWLLCVHHPGA
uniref:B30.2/SPRY domain-containing protein n=1 Tax=Erpetoichthys calabaricus TaxID=27687 RepID=A0A8C4X371_ERPCA